MIEMLTQAEILFYEFFVAENYGFLTGSRAFGCEREGSDYDIVTTVGVLTSKPGLQDALNPIDQFIANLPELQVTLTQKSLYQNGVYYFFADGSTANIIPIQTMQIPAWIFATNALIVYTRMSYKIGQLHGSLGSTVAKEERIGLFEQFRASFRLAGKGHGCMTQDVNNLIAQQNRGELYG